MNQKKTASIIKKFLLFNLIVFSVLGLFTFLYLIAIQPNLVKQRTANHIDIINNTTDHLDRLNIQFNKEGINTFLLSARFLFQSLDRVQIYNNQGEIIHAQALKNSKLINVPLKDLSIPDGIRIGIIFREGKISIPDKETIIHENDDVVFISLLKSIRKAEDLFQVSEIY